MDFVSYTVANPPRLPHLFVSSNPARIGLPRRHGWPVAWLMFIHHQAKLWLPETSDEDQPDIVVDMRYEFDRLCPGWQYGSTCYLPWAVAYTYGTEETISGLLPRPKGAQLVHGFGVGSWPSP